MKVEEYIKTELNTFLKDNKIELPIILQRPKESNHGDYASNLAMQLAKHFKKNPREIAHTIISSINLDKKYITKAEIAGPGFINFYASSENLYDNLIEIFEKQSEFGKVKLDKPVKAQVEFVSANPTGPLTIGHGRQAVLGDTVANILEAGGFDVTREYYFNDAGRQMRFLGESVRTRYLQICGQEIELDEDHYQGEYIRDIANDIFKKHNNSLIASTDLSVFTSMAEDTIFKDIKGTIKKLGFEFDVFFNEKSLYEHGQIDQIIEKLESKGLVYEKDGAKWFKSSSLGFDQDRVLVKSTGEPTYRLPDIAYHVEKFKRNFDIIIDIFGADHIDTYPDVLAALKVLGYDEAKVNVLIHQFVTLTDKGEQVKMSTRKANFVTLDELIEDVGVDVTRYFFLMRGMNTHLNFDLGLAKTQSDENPVFYIQYAHARICSIISLADSKNINTQNHSSEILENLTKKEEINLIKELLLFPDIIKICVKVLEPQKLVNYLFNLAATFHRFYTECRVLTEDKNLTMARLALIDATRLVIANALQILRITAPNKM